MTVIQLPLFSSRRARGPERGRLDDASERLLGAFAHHRSSAGAHPRSVAREVSQLRALVRASAASGGPADLEGLASDMETLARVLREPPAPIARSTGCTRLIAAQRFIAFARLREGRDPEDDRARLDALLPMRKATGWHDGGVVVAGTVARTRRRAPTLEAADLFRLVEAAGVGGGRRALRNRALLALHCFTGLRAEEIVRLYWQDLSADTAAPDPGHLEVTVVRDGVPRRLPVPDTATRALQALAASYGSDLGERRGPVIATSTGRPLGYRAARDVVRAACQGAQLPLVEASDLRAAFAQWLRTLGLSDHEVAFVLGVSRVRTVDRLLSRHAALAAQRRAREVLCQ